MKKSNRVRSPLFIIELVFGLIGIIMLVVGAGFLISTMNFMEDAAVVEAEIVEMRSESDSDGDMHYMAYVDYEYEGKDYTMIRLPESTFSMQTGKSVEIYIDRDNPKDAHLKSSVYLLPLLFLGMGALFFVMAAIFLCVQKKQKKRREGLLQKGRKVYAEIQRGVVDYTYRVNGKHPCRLECTYMDEASGQPVICTSDRTWLEPDLYIGRQVPVYLDIEDSSNYYVDLDSLTEGRI